MAGVIRRTKVKQDDIHDEAIRSKHIAPDTIVAADVGPDAVGSSELDAGAVAYSDQIIADRIGSEHIAPSAIAYADQIIDDRIGSQHIDDDAIAYADQIKDGIVGNAELAASGLDISKMTVGTAGIDRIPILPIAKYGSAIMDVADSVGSQHIVDSAVIMARIAADAIDGTKIADDAIGSEHITDSAVITARIATDAVDGTKIADDAIGSEHIEDNAVAYATQLKDDVVTGAKVAESPLSGSDKIAVIGSYATGSHVAFGITYGMTPVVVLENLASGIDTLYKDSVAAGSFAVTGSPSGLYYKWWAQGLT